MAVSLTGTSSLTMPTKSPLTAWNNTPDELNTRLSLGKGTLRWFFESQWPATHWGDCDLKVSENYPNPTCLSPQKMWHLQINSWLIGSLMVTTTLHTSSIPLWGMLGFSTRRTGTNPASPVITVIICTHSSMSEQPYPSCSGTHTKIQMAITPGCQSSDAEPQQPWPQLTLTVIVPVGINITINDLRFCMQHKWHYRYPTCLPP